MTTQGGFPRYTCPRMGSQWTTPIDEGDSYTLTGLADWELMVSPEVALDLDIRAGAADLDLDLTHLNVRRVFVGAGASQIRIRLPESGLDTG